MREYGPHILIEDHYHIRDLISAQEKRSEDRTYHRDKAKLAQERLDEIKDAKIKETKQFWCSACREDFIAESIKEVEIDWSCPTQYVAFYRTKCFRGHWCMRLITDKYKDAFWFKSRRTKADQGSHSLDLLQPHQTGYNIMYKKI